MSQEKQYIGTYKVVKIFRVSAKRKVLRSGLTYGAMYRLGLRSTELSIYNNVKNENKC